MRTKFLVYFALLYTSTKLVSKPNKQWYRGKSGLKLQKKLSYNISQKMKFSNEVYGFGHIY